MAQTAAYLVDHVIPLVRVRQVVIVWVMRLPIPLRLLPAAQPNLVRPERQVVHCVLTRFLVAEAGLKAAEVDSGVVTLIQRFGRAARATSWRVCWPTRSPKSLGQQFIVDNIGGAGSTIGTMRAAKATPAGYTLVQTGVGQNAVAHGLDPKLGYDSMRDFVHISQVHSGPNVLVVNAATPYKTFAELVEFVRKNPGKLNYGYTHAASCHMAMAVPKQRASECAKGVKECNGLYMVGIPYRGGGPMMQDLLGGQIPPMFINQDVARPHVKAGKLCALAVTSTQRNPLCPACRRSPRADLPASRPCRGRACWRSGARRRASWASLARAWTRSWARRK